MPIDPLAPESPLAEVAHGSSALPSTFAFFYRIAEQLSRSCFVYRATYSLSRHLRRLMDSAHALAFEAIPSPEDVTVAIMATLAANEMVDGAHARVTLTRGLKSTSSMNPEFNVYG